MIDEPVAVVALDFDRAVIDRAATVGDARKLSVDSGRKWPDPGAGGAPSAVIRFAEA